MTYSYLVHLNTLFMTKIPLQSSYWKLQQNITEVVYSLIQHQDKTCARSL